MKHIKNNFREEEIKNIGNEKMAFNELSQIRGGQSTDEWDSGGLEP